MVLRMVSDRNEMEWVAFWKKHELHLHDSQTVSDRGIRYLNILTQPDQIGHGVGKIRPNIHGKFDVYLTLSRLSFCGVREQLALSDLSEEFLLHGFDPDNPDDVRKFEMMHCALSDRGWGPENAEQREAA